MPAAMTTFEATKETVQGFIRMFKCERCNECERAIARIFVGPWDVARLAKFLEIEPANFLNRYTFRDGNAYYMRAPCPFFAAGGCMVHNFKPSVCLQFPFNQTVKCKTNDGIEHNFITINTGCPAGKKLAEKFAINPESVGVG